MDNFYLKTKRFWKCLGIRALKTMAQTALASLGTTALITEVNWPLIVSTTAMAGLLSVLNSIGVGLPEVDMPSQKEGE